MRKAKAKLMLICFSHPFKLFVWLNLFLTFSDSLYNGDTFKPNAQEGKMERLLFVVPKVTQLNFGLTRVRP